MNSPTKAENTQYQTHFTIPDDWVIPKRVTIETIFGCNASCIMCPINNPTPRKKGVMPLDMFKEVIDSLVPIKDHLQMMDLYCLGEPLLDPYIFERIRYVKGYGFRNLGIATNANLLNREKQEKLLESRVDTVLFSIDGINKETHESIRRNVTFERVIENVQGIIRLRDQGNYTTRFGIRFIRQDSNRDQWEAYKDFWQQVISKEKNDFITLYDAHSWGGEVNTKDNILKEHGRHQGTEEKPCYMVSDILYILSDGSVPLCSEDWHKADFNFGNVKAQSPLEIFNCERFQKIRALHRAGKKSQMAICRECTVLYSLTTKETI